MPKKKKYTYAHDQEIILTLAENTSEYRLKSNMTQEELADAADVGLAQIKRIESGKVNTSISSAFRIAKALGVTIEDLLHKKEE